MALDRKQNRSPQVQKALDDVKAGRTVDMTSVRLAQKFLRKEQQELDRIENEMEDREAREAISDLCRQYKAREQNKKDEAAAFVPVPRSKKTRE